MKSDEKQCKSMKINTNRLKSMKPMKIDENQRKPIENQ
jgi:hypothetical protein